MDTLERAHQRVLISGASIAGLTTAYWLTRHGFTVTVIERAPTLRVGGNGVDVRGLAIDVVKRMELWPRIKEAAVELDGTSFVDAKGRSVARIDMRAVKRRAASAEVEILRGDLVSILHDATRQDVEVLFGDSIDGLD